MAKYRRPLIISIISILFVAYSIISIVFSYKTITDNSIPYWNLLLSITIHLAGFVAIAGIWLMRRWGLFLYITLAIIIQLQMSLLNNWSPYLLVTPFIIIGSCLLFFKRFR
jgi:hypothetical protein